MTAIAVEHPRDLPDPSEILGMVAVDTETTGLYVDDGAYTTVVSVAYRTAQGIFLHAYPFDVGDPERKGFSVVRYKVGPTKGLPKGDPEGRWDWDADPNLDRHDWYDLRKWLVATGKACGHVYQNAKFDLHMLRAGAPHGWPGVELEPYARWDTMLASFELFPGESTSLKPTCARIWGEEAVEEAAEQKEALAAVKLRYGLKAADGPRYDLVPWEVLEAYAAADAALTLQLAEHQGALFDEGHADQTQFERAMGLMRVLYAMERRGFGPYDVERSRRIADAMAARIAQLIPVIAAEFGVDSDGDEALEGITPAMAREHFFERLGLSPWGPGDVPHGSPDPKTGKPRAGSCGVAVVRRMAAAGAPGAAEYAEYVELVTARRMFYENYAELAGPDRRIRTGFRQAYVRSGRMSVERFQAQAMPKHLGITLRGKRVPEPRELFEVDPGRVRVNLDLTQAELRIAAKFSGCTSMVEALETGADFHGQTTTKVFGITQEDPDWSAKRDIAKRLTFGSIFMVGGRTFRNTLYQLAGIDWPLRDCEAAVSAWRRAYPEFATSYEYWQHVALETKRVELYDGTFSWMLAPTDYPNTAWNRRVQGSLARWVNHEWLPYIEARTREHEALVLTVHDSVVLDLPEDSADEIVADIEAETADLWLKAFGIPGGCDRSEFAK